MSGIFIKAGFFAAILGFHIRKAEEIREKKYRMEKQLALSEKKYVQDIQKIKDMGSVMHDTKKHLLYIRECIRQMEYEEAVAYITHMVKIVDKSGPRFNTGNLMVDAAMSNTATIAAENNILFETHIQLSGGKINIDSYDLNIVLGNLLDNSIKACTKIFDRNKKLIKVIIVEEEKILLIRVVNSVQQQKLLLGGNRNREGKQRSAYGLRNIQKVAAKYGGTFQYGYKAASFEAVVILPFSYRNRNFNFPADIF